MTKKSSILLSFVGTNDAGRLINKSDGAILHTLQNESFSKIILLWNNTKIADLAFKDIVEYLSSEIKKRELCNNLEARELKLDDVTDHNEIYLKLKEFTDLLDKNSDYKYTAAISSGTPAMQVAWILLAESGDFSISNPMRLIKTKDPKFGESSNIEVKLNTSLPQIIGLSKELDKVRKDLIPKVSISKSRGIISIGDRIIDFSPIEFCYYRYFADRVINKKGLEKFSGYTVSLSFMKIIYRFHEETFYDFYSGREELGDLIKKEYEIGITTFRGNISRINKKLKEQLKNDTLFKAFCVYSEGKRGAKVYGLKLTPDKIKYID